MQIAMITVPREPMYLYESLASLLASIRGSHGSASSLEAPSTIDVFIGVPDEQIPYEMRSRLLWSEPWSDHVDTHVISEELWELIEPLPSKLRAVGNFYAALRQGDGDLMLFEDDIAVKPGWIRALDEIFTERIWPVEGPHGIDLFATLYNHAATQDRDHVLLKKPIRGFRGTLGLFVPERHRYSLAEAALQHLQPDDPRPVEQRWPFDEIVKMYVSDHASCQLAVTYPSYVDHRGDVSLINPTHGPRRAPSF